MSTRNDNGKALNEKVQIHEDGSKEYWRDVPEYEGLYRVSDQGRVKSLKRSAVRNNGRPIHIRERMLKQAAHAVTGHLTMSLHKIGFPGERHSAHELVLLAFVGPCPQGMECCHFPDRNPANNLVENLRWDTRSANRKDAALHGTLAAGETCGLSKLTWVEVREIRSLYATGLYYVMELAKKYRVGTMAIYRLLRGITWKDKNYQPPKRFFPSRTIMGRKNGSKRVKRGVFYDAFTP